MARKDKVDVIRQAIKQLIAEHDPSLAAPGAENRHNQILNNLLSQLDSIQVEESKIEDEVDSKAGSKNDEAIIKELKNVKRQNFITQCLVSTMIVLTLVWQVSEISVALKIRGVLCNPVKSFGGWLSGGRGEMNIQDAIKQVSKNPKQVLENTSIPGLLPGFDPSDDRDDK